MMKGEEERMIAKIWKWEHVVKRVLAEGAFRRNHVI